MPMTINRSNKVYTENKITKIEDFPFDKAYFGSPNKLPSTMKLDGPFFITPYIGAASIFAVRPQHLQKYGVPRGISINRAYKEWDINLKDTLLQEPLKELHVILQGAPDIKESVEIVSGYIYTVDITPDIRNHIYQSDKMNKEMEFCIDKLDTIDFSNIQEVTVKMTVSGAPARIKDRRTSYTKGVNSSIFEESTINEPDDCYCESFDIERLSSDILLRPADKYYLDTIIEWKMQTILEGYPNEQPPPEEYNKLSNYVKNETPKMLDDTRIIMYDNDQPIGMIIAYQKEQDWFIDDIFLIPEFRHKGIGRMILENEIASHDQLALWVYKSNIHAISLYESLGFKVENSIKERQMMRLRKTDVELIKGWRVTYQGIGIYEALKNAMFEQTGSSNAWISFINSDACNWLPKPPSYGNDNKSFFTEKGFNRFDELVLPIIAQYIDQTKIYREEIMVPTNQIVYSDEFQFVISDTIQESSYLKNNKKVGFNMIISEVLDAIDNINSTSISNEINVCESLLISYDKMSVIIENCNDTSYDEFQIIQEGSKLDALKEDFKKQNEGKSTINKIIFAIPRLLRSLFRLITGKLKKCENTLETIDDTIKKNKSKAKAGQIISLFATLACGAFYIVYLHQTLKEVSSTKYGKSQSLGSFLKMIFKEEMPSIYKAIIKTENKIKSVKKVHNIKKYIKKHEKEKKSIDNNEFNISEAVKYAFEEFDVAFATKNIFYSNKLFAVITKEKLEPMIRAAAIEEFEVINDDLISSLKYIIKQMESVQDEESKQAIENTGNESFARYEAEIISKIKELLKEREEKKRQQTLSLKTLAIAIRFRLSSASTILI